MGSSVVAVVLMLLRESGVRRVRQRSDSWSVRRAIVRVQCHDGSSEAADRTAERGPADGGKRTSYPRSACSSASQRTPDDTTRHDTRATHRLSELNDSQASKQPTKQLLALQAVRRGHTRRDDRSSSGRSGNAGDDATVRWDDGAEMIGTDARTMTKDGERDGARERTVAVSE